MKKAILLNDGGYFGMDHVVFPCEVEVVDGCKSYYESHGDSGHILVSRSELIRVGADHACFADDRFPWGFEVGVSIKEIT